jgi:hypothetical protein
MLPPFLVFRFLDPDESTSSREPSNEGSLTVSRELATTISQQVSRFEDSARVFRQINSHVNASADLLSGKWPRAWIAERTARDSREADGIA